jgi:Cdc6-like AAA superfamily ATPase
MPTIRAGIESIQQDQNRAQLDALKTWISPMDVMAQHSDILRRRHEGTGQWFLEDPKVTKWLNGSTSNKTLLCTGIPGAGKTVLAAVTVEHLIAKARNSTTGVACLYCSYKSQTEQSVEVLLQAILQQLIQTEVPGITRLVEEIQHHHKARGSRPTSDELVKSLQAAFAELTSIYIVIDALDECAMEDGTRRQLLAYLAQIRKNADIRLMITSRHVPDVVDEFQNASKIEIRARDEDIRRYLRGQLDRLPKCIQGDAELQQMIQEKVTEATSGM